MIFERRMEHLEDQMCSFFLLQLQNFFWHVSQISSDSCHFKSNNIEIARNVQKCEKHWKKSIQRWQKCFEHTQSSVPGGEANVSRRSRSSRWGIAFGIYQIFLKTFPILYIFPFYIPQLSASEQINPTTMAVRQLLTPIELWNHWALTVLIGVGGCLANEAMRNPTKQPGTPCE